MAANGSRDAGGNRGTRISAEYGEATLSEERVQGYDAIVIGAGAAGCFAAKELTEGGLRVLLLEAGPEVDAERDFPESPPRDRGLVDRVLLGLAGQHIQARCGAFNRATRRFYVNDRDNPYTTGPQEYYNWFRGRQVGGRLHTWGRIVPRLSDWEFKPRAHGLEGLDWPISYENLAPFYDRVEEFLGVHGTCEGLPHVPDGRFIAPRPLNPLEEHVREAVLERWPTRRFIPARVVKHNSTRTPTPLRAALQTGRLTLRANAVVERIHIAGDRPRARGVAFVDRVTRKRENVDANFVVVCASAIESIRLLLNSACPACPDGLGNSSGLLGRFFMDHCMVTTEGIVPAEVNRRCPPGNADVPGDSYDFAALYLYMPGFRNITEPAPQFSGSYSILGSVGRWDGRFAFIGLGEMLPRFENRVSIDPALRDACGIPVPRIECAHSANDRALIADMASALEDIVAVSGLQVQKSYGRGLRGIRGAFWRRVGANVWTSYDAYHPGAAMHELGGARMGTDPGQSVVDPYNECWDVRNLFVTDGACFASSGYQNTTLTIMALTVRACDFIVRRHRDGNL